jgi:hypothetical protein
MKIIQVIKYLQNETICCREKPRDSSKRIDMMKNSYFMTIFLLRILNCMFFTGLKFFLQGRISTLHEFPNLLNF